MQHVFCGSEPLQFVALDATCNTTAQLIQYVSGLDAYGEQRLDFC